MATVCKIQSDDLGSIAAVSTTFRRVGQGASMESSTVESERQVRYRTAGTLSKLYVTILTNDRGASTLRLRKNAANANQVLSITASTTGEFEDAVNTDAVASGDDFNKQLITGAGGTTFMYKVTRLLFSSNTLTDILFTCNASNINSAATEFNPIVGSPTSLGTENFNRIKIQTAGTFKNLGVFVSANTRDADVSYRLRVNAANVNQVVTIPTVTTGWFEDLVNTDVIAAADFVGYSTVGAGTAGVVTIETSKVEFQTTNSSFMFGGARSVSTAAATTVFYPLAGDAFSSATEANVVADAGTPFTASFLGVFLASNAVTAASTWRFRKNAADGNQVASIAASTSGHFEDAVNTDSVIATDSLGIQLATGATGTTLNTRGYEMLATVAAAGGGSTLLYMGCG